VILGHRRELHSHECEGARGVGCHNWEVGKERLQHIGIMHSDLGRRICPNFRGKTSPLKAFCWVCVLIPEPIGCPCAWRGMREEWLGGDNSSFFQRRTPFGQIRTTMWRQPRALARLADAFPWEGKTWNGPLGFDPQVPSKYTSKTVYQLIEQREPFSTPGGE
jgi:hypothetical protein